MWLLAVTGTPIFSGCYPDYRPPAREAPQAFLDVRTVPGPKLCVDGKYYFLPSQERGGWVRVPAEQRVGVLSEIYSAPGPYWGGFSCSPRLSFATRSGEAYQVRFRLVPGKCVLDVHQVRDGAVGPPEPTIGPLFTGDDPLTCAF